MKHGIDYKKFINQKIQREITIYKMAENGDMDIVINEDLLKIM